jgi:signal transduction histidine kinase
VADRVRNPAAIIGCACKRILSKEKDGKYGESLKDVVDECKKLEAIVGDFENLLRINRGLFKYEDMHVILKGVVTVLEKEAEKKGVRMVLKYVSYPLKINMHRNLLKAAIYHVIRNAIEATPPGGTITLITEEQDDSVVLTIVDTGPGIPKENLERIFDPFFSTKQMRFGMGLALVKQIVSEHLGEISVESDVGSGTTFRLTLPKRWVEKKTDIQALTT